MVYHPDLCTTINLTALVKGYSNRSTTVQVLFMNIKLWNNEHFDFEIGVVQGFDRRQYQTTPIVLEYRGEKEGRGRKKSTEIALPAVGLDCLLIGGSFKTGVLVIKHLE